MMPTSAPIASSRGRKPASSSNNRPYVTIAVTTMPPSKGMRNSRDSPMAPPRNAARSVAIAAISPGEDAELGRERLKQHRHDIGQQHHPQQGISVPGARLDIRREIARIHIGNGNDHGRPGKWQ